MADVKKALCCASSEQKCVSCQSSCSCADGQCQCSSPSDFLTLQATPCAGSDMKKGCSGDNICACPQQCPCRQAGCGRSGLAVSACSTGGKSGEGVACTLPGNCGCHKGCMGKL